MIPAAVVLFFAALWTTTLVPEAAAVTVVPGFVVEDAYPDATFDIPVQVVFFADGRRLVVQQGGKVWMMSAAGEQRSTPFIDLSAKVLGLEGMGLLGVVLDPDFATNRWVYFAYTVDPDSNGVDNDPEAYARIERYQVSLADSDVVDTTTREVLIGPSWSTGIPCPDQYHTIGSLRFGRDGSLLVASGEGARFGNVDAGGQDPGQFLPGRASSTEDLGAFRSQTLNSLGGKILRIDKNTGHGLPSNPYWDGNPISARSRVWVYGVRNPYRFTVRPGTGNPDPQQAQPGVLYIGDTGWNTYEWVHLAQQGGLNMGWPCREGPLPQPLYQAVTQTQYPNPNVVCSAPPSPENPALPTSPLLWWHHGDGSLSYPQDWSGYATIGGSFHVGGSYPPPYAGAYYVADFAGGWIKWVQLDATDHVLASGDFVAAAAGPVDVEWDPITGDMFYVSLVANKVRRIRYLSSTAIKSVSFRADSADGSAPPIVPSAASPWIDVAQDHDGTLANFSGESTSGWQGKGSAVSPYCLRFDGVDDRVTITAATIPELHPPTAVTTALWIRTGADVQSIQYLLEWLETFDGSYPGMSLAIGFGKLRVFLSPWADAATLLPNRWYHVAAVKDGDGTRVYLDGQRVLTSGVSNLGSQNSELVLGASTYRGAGQYGEHYAGSMAELAVWPEALSDAQVLGDFQAGRLRFQAGDKITEFRADSASGSGPNPVPGSASPWRDLIAEHDGTLFNFNGTSSSGWQGSGSYLAPYRLKFDGTNDRVTIPAGSIPELNSPTAATISMWIKTDSDVTLTQYLVEWLQEYQGAYPGMTLAISNGNLRVFLSPWVNVYPVEPNTWYFVTMVKNESQVRVYVNETRRFTSSTPNLGGQLSELVLGASTYAGPGDYHEFFHGSIAQVLIWQRALIDPEVQEAFHESESLYVAPPLSSEIMRVSADSANITTPYPVPGAGSPWRDLVGSHSPALNQFNGNASSGWQGNGSPASPYRLKFDGTNSRLTLPAGSIPDIQANGAVTLAMWFRTGSQVTTTTYLLEWLSQYTAPTPGMSLSISNGSLRLFLNPWVNLAPVYPDAWYHLVVVRNGPQVRAHLNGVLVYTGTGQGVGAQNSELVVGASTYRGPGLYGEYFAGAVGDLALWPVALGDVGAQLLYSEGAPQYLPTTDIDPPAVVDGARLMVRPNPTRGHLTIELTVPRAGSFALEIFGVDGRRIRTVASGSWEPGRQLHLWDGRDDSGRRVGPGIYFVRLSGPGGTGWRRFVLIR